MRMLCKVLLLILFCGSSDCMDTRKRKREDREEQEVMQEIEELFEYPETNPLASFVKIISIDPLVEEVIFPFYCRYKDHYGCQEIFHDVEQEMNHIADYHGIIPSDAGIPCDLTKSSRQLLREIFEPRAIDRR